ncbi:MAG: hypothetical protein IH944_13365 [Armatimonadetes bacterium]|nr:hypothetical protein [Armatimonadota bacterium]
MTDLQTIAASVATTLALLFIREWWVRRLAKGDEQVKQLTERLNRERNVWRHHEDDISSLGRATKIEWYVNPFWVFESSDGIAIRQWEDMKLEEVTFGTGENKRAIKKHVQLTMDRVLRARHRKEWLVFTEWNGTLTYYLEAPAKADDSFLFQDLPTSRRVLKRLSKG